MAPEPIVGRYKLYKAGTSKLGKHSSRSPHRPQKLLTLTDVVVNWLAKTGSVYCDLKKVLSSLSCGTPGKKRRSKTGPAHVDIRTQELIKLAEIICNGRPPPNIPEDILTITKDVIKGREECAEWYDAQALGKLSKENDTHQFFITVLHRVLELLECASEKQKACTAPPVMPKSKESKKAKTVACPQDKLSNLFSILTLEEPLSSTVEESRQPLSTKATNTATPTLMDFVLEMENDDGAFVGLSAY